MGKILDATIIRRILLMTMNSTNFNYLNER